MFCSKVVSTIKAHTFASIVSNVAGCFLRRSSSSGVRVLETATTIALNFSKRIVATARPIPLILIVSEVTSESDNHNYLEAPVTRTTGFDMTVCEVGGGDDEKSINADLKRH